MTRLSASSKPEQMEAKRAFIHPRPIMNCRLPSLPELSLVPELLLCNIANRKTAWACVCALQEWILYWGCSRAFTTTGLSIDKEITRVWHKLFYVPLM